MGLLISGLIFGFALLGLVIGIVGVTKGRRYLSGQIMPLQEIHEMVDPAMKNAIEIEDSEQTEQEQSGDTHV